MHTLILLLLSVVVLSLCSLLVIAGFVDDRIAVRTVFGSGYGGTSGRLASQAVGDFFNPSSSC